jgi:hypothetical protein
MLYQLCCKVRVGGWDGGYAEDVRSVKVKLS